MASNTHWRPVKSRVRASMNGERMDTIGLLSLARPRALPDQRRAA
jgi:hypothetical protein